MGFNCLDRIARETLIESISLDLLTDASVSRPAVDY